MASVMQGDAYNIPVTIKSGNGTLITPEIAACVEITVGQFTKRWPGQVTFDEKTGEWQFPVTQKQTFRFAPGTAVVQARVVFQDGSIMGGSGAPVRVEQSASRGTLPQPEKTEAVTGSAPMATEVTIPTVHDIDVSLHSQVILSDPIKAPYIGDNGNWYEYDAATGTFIDTGTSASGTPLITPETAGKYLTNDGSKAEWGEVKKSVEVGDAKDGNLLKLRGSDVLDAATPSVDYALPTLYVTITQDGEDGSGNPIYKSDKTYDEIKAAYEEGREVKIAKSGVFDNELMSALGINDVPFGGIVDIIVNDPAANFSAFGVPTVFLGNALPPSVGGQALSKVSVNIHKSGLVNVFSPFIPTHEWPKILINKLPQQYLATVSMTAGGELSSTTTFDKLVSIYEAYQAFAAPDGIAALCAQITYPNGAISPIHMMASLNNRMVVFQDVSADGLSTIRCTKTGDKDVWRHSITPLGIPPVPVTTADNGKFLRVVDGQWAAEAVANAKGVSF